jgi:2-dehydropantoate 2-reductase
MRVLVVGAGAIGGYFGGRLAEAGRDVTFLVRPGRAAQLAKTGLVVRSPHGDIHLPNPVLVQAQDLAAPYDLVILSCKAYDLDNAIESFAPAVGPQTAILPLLNGMSHLDTLDRRFGPDRVLGGQCVIGVTLDEDGHILHLNENHGLTYGERDGAISERMEGIARVFERAKFQAHSSEVILLEMWEKWVFLASLASGTCLMRAAVGDIVAAPGGAEFLLGLFDECRSVSEGEGYIPRGPFLERSRKMLTTAGSPFTASMLRDIERGARIEADHVLGDLIRRGRERAPDSPRPKLETAYLNLKAYEARRERQG